MKILLPLAALLCTGCLFTRTVYVPPGTAVRLRQDVKAKIWAKDSQGNLVPGKMVLKEGWYVLPPKGEDDVE